MSLLDISFAFSSSVNFLIAFAITRREIIIAAIKTMKALSILWFIQQYNQTLGLCKKYAVQKSSVSAVMFVGLPVFIAAGFVQ